MYDEGYWKYCAGGWMLADGAGAGAGVVNGARALAAGG